jgi:hypothetical protein
MISYWAFVKCRWVWVTTSRAIWAALPHVSKTAIVCGAIGSMTPATPVSNGRAHGVIPPAVVRELPPGAYLRPEPVRVPEPAGLMVLGVGLVALGLIVKGKA